MGDAFSGGIMLALAAVLWLAILVPSMARRHDERQTEKNALRLQRTVRVLAETSDIPLDLRVEATARDALAQEKFLRAQQKRQKALDKLSVEKAKLNDMGATMHTQNTQHHEEIQQMQGAVRGHKQKPEQPYVRSIRGFIAFVAAVSLLLIFLGAGLAFFGQGVNVLVISSIVFLLSFSSLVLLAPARAKRRMQKPAQSDMHNKDADNEAVNRQVKTAIPQLEEPFQEDAAFVAHVKEQELAAERIERARVLAKRKAAGLEAARAQAEAQKPTSLTSSDSMEEKLRQIGVVGDTRGGMPDLDAALNRARKIS